MEEKLRQLPQSPGVYLMKDSQDKIIYVGKAVSLKNRVRSYFRGSHDNSPKTALMVSKIDHIDTIVTDSEVEALILEQNMIKQYHPRYNVALKDDKKFPFIKITNETFPRIEVTRFKKKEIFYRL